MKGGRAAGDACPEAQCESFGVSRRPSKTLRTTSDRQDPLDRYGFGSESPNTTGEPSSVRPRVRSTLNSAQNDPAAYAARLASG